MKILATVAVLALAASPAAAQNFELEFTEQGINRLVDQLGDPGKSGAHQPTDVSSLGYGKCTAVGILDCSPKTTSNVATVQPTAGTTRPAATLPVQGGARTNVHLALCQGPDGKSAIVPAQDVLTWQWWITESHFTVRAQQLQFTARVRYRVGTEWVSEEKTVPATLSLDVAAQKLRMAISTFKVPVRHSANGVTETITEVDVGQHMSFAIPISAQTFQITDLEGHPRTVTSRAQSANVEYLPGQIRVKVYGGFN